MPLGIFNYSVLVPIKTMLWSLAHPGFPPPIPFLQFSLELNEVTKSLAPTPGHGRDPGRCPETLDPIVSAGKVEETRLPPGRP